MSDMKCPFCGDEMKLTSLYIDGNHRYSHKYIGALSGGKDRCPFDGATLPLRALQEIHRTRKALDVAKKWLMKIGYLNMSDHGLGSEKMMTDWCKTVALHGLKEIETAIEQKE